MTHKISKKLLSQGIIALGAAAWLAPAHIHAENPGVAYQDFDHGLDDAYEVGTHYGINPMTGQPQREYAGERSAVQDMAADFTDGYATLDARITGIRRVDTPRGEHVIAKAAVENDRMIVIDLGPGANLADLNLRDGDTIQVRGLADSETGGHLFVADRLHFNGQTVAINTDFEDTNAMAMDFQEEDDSTSLATTP